ncbi:MAG: RcnB family protein [Alphaproteobacteria bacterium]|nr:RcnB family protein [Alphaproteobacteria bacterium]
MNKLFTRFTVLLFFSLIFITHSGFAQNKKDKNHGPKTNKQQDVSNNFVPNDRVLRNLDSSKLGIISSHMQSSYRQKCPPGLAKKNNGCLPPGQAKKYSIGQPLPSDVVYWEVPRDIQFYLPPPPPATQYIWVDQDLLLISAATRKVLDAVSLFSAVQ